MRRIVGKAMIVVSLCAVASLQPINIARAESHTPGLDELGSQVSTQLSVSDLYTSTNKVSTSVSFSGCSFAVSISYIYPGSFTTEGVSHHLDNLWTGNAGDIDPASVSVQPIDGEDDSKVVEFRFEANDGRRAFTYTGWRGPKYVNFVEVYTAPTARLALSSLRTLATRCAGGTL